MGLQYDKINEAKNLIKALRAQFIDGLITAQELAEQEAKVKAEIRELFGFDPETPS